MTSMPRTNWHGKEYSSVKGYRGQALVQGNQMVQVRSAGNIRTHPAGHTGAAKAYVYGAPSVTSWTRHMPYAASRLSLLRKATRTTAPRSVSSRRGCCFQSSRSTLFTCRLHWCEPALQATQLWHRQMETPREFLSEK